jgi:hypothetical protein
MTYSFVREKDGSLLSVFCFAFCFPLSVFLLYVGSPGISITGRTSTVPLRAMGIRAAMPIASSRLFASMRK